MMHKIVSELIVDTCAN